MQENFRVKGKKLYFGFVDLEKAFDRVPREVIQWYGLPRSPSDRDQIVYSTLRSQSMKNKTDPDHEPNS